MILMLVLFMNYYVHEYVTRTNNIKRLKQKSDTSKQNGMHMNNKYE
jgi:hypothetical protein